MENFVQRFARAIVEINRDEGISVILVEQNSRMALKISNRTYALEIGRIAPTGTTADLLSDDHIRSLSRSGAIVSGKLIYTTANFTSMLFRVALEYGQT
jgi:energy-coupling factor transporter ATP-binding protein EcfA2